MNTPLITCPICYKQFKSLTNSHLKYHGITHDEFITLYPNSPRFSEHTKALYGSQSIQSRNTIASIHSNKRNERILKYNTNPKLCAQCLNPIKYKDHTRKKFCCRSCSASYNNKHNPRTLSTETIERLRMNGRSPDNITRLQANRGSIIKWHGTNTCVTCKQSFYVNSKSKYQKCCSKECRRIYHSINNYRENTTTAKCGRYKGIWCASSWELAFLAYHMHFNTDIKRFIGYIPYEHNGVKYNYFPDFFMNNIIYEVKGYMTPKDVSKFMAAEQLGYTLIPIMKDDIIPIINELKRIYSITDVTELYDPAT